MTPELTSVPKVGVIQQHLRLFGNSALPLIRLSVFLRLVIASLSCWISIGHADSDELRLRVERKRLPGNAKHDDLSASDTVDHLALDAPAADSLSMLRTVAGVSVIQGRSSGQGGEIRIRGATPLQTQTYINGISLDGVRSASFDQSAVNLGMVQDVEVYRSATPIGWGTQAIGGTINYNTTRGPRHRLKAFVAVGSFDQLGLGVAGKHTFGVTQPTQIYAAVSLSGGRFDFEYFNDNGTVANNADDAVVPRHNNWRETGTAIVGLQTRRNNWVLQLEHISLLSRGGLAGLGTAPTDAANEDNRSHISSLRTTVVSGKHVLKQLMYIRHGRSEQFDPKADFGLVPRHTNNTIYIVGERLHYAIGISDYVDLSLVHSLENQLFEPSDSLVTATLRQPSRRTFFRHGVSPVIHFGPSVDWLFSGQHEYVSSRIATQGVLTASPLTVSNSDASHWTGRTGLQWHILPALQLKSNLSYAKREPTLNELFGDSQFIDASPSLQPERAWTADIGMAIRWSHDHHYLTAQAWYFHRQSQDLISYRRSTPTTFRAGNFESAGTDGLETNFTLDALNHLRISSTFALTIAKFGDDTPIYAGNFLPLVPGLTSTATIEPYLAWSPIAERISLYGQMYYRSTITTDPANNVKVPHRLQFDIGARVYAIDHQFKFEFVTRNVANNQQIDAFGYPIAGRHFGAKLSYAL